MRTFIVGFAFAIAPYFTANIPDRDIFAKVFLIIFIFAGTWMAICQDLKELSN